MINIPKIGRVVKNDLCIGCGLCAYKCPNRALEMKWNEFGFIVPELSGNCDSIGDCVTVCPFNPFPGKEVETENELAEIFHKQTRNYHPNVGKYNSIYAGYSEEFRLTSSSGGIATFILTKLLEKGIVDHVFSVKESQNSGSYYEYRISSNREELIASSKTKYYPVTMATVFNKINQLKGKVAVIGVACFIKAIRLAQYSDPSLKEKIPFLVGIICGGIKSSFFAEYLAEKSGVSKLLYVKPEFRIKDISSSAGDYSFGCKNKTDNLQHYVKMRSVGDMWGTGLFKANACDFCDDVTTELADISLGDAWIPPFNTDGRGTSVVVTRSNLVETLIQEGISSGKIEMQKIGINQFILSQKSSFTHRQQALQFRINNNKNISPKRFVNGRISIIAKIIQVQRRRVRRKSLYVWKETGGVIQFDHLMNNELRILRKLTQISHNSKYSRNRVIKYLI